MLRQIKTRVDSLRAAYGKAAAAKRIGRDDPEESQKIR
jgi:hypothetical protein